jgi:hypothetical protein
MVQISLKSTASSALGRRMELSADDTTACPKKAKKIPPRDLLSTLNIYIDIFRSIFALFGSKSLDLPPNFEHFVPKPYFIDYFWDPVLNPPTLEKIKWYDKPTFLTYFIGFLINFGGATEILGL